MTNENRFLYLLLLVLIIGCTNNETSFSNNYFSFKHDDKWKKHDEIDSSNVHVSSFSTEEELPLGVVIFLSPLDSNIEEFFGKYLDGFVRDDPTIPYEILNKKDTVIYDSPGLIANIERYFGSYAIKSEIIVFEKCNKTFLLCFQGQKAFWEFRYPEIKLIKETFQTKCPN